MEANTEPENVETCIICSKGFLMSDNSKKVNLTEKCMTTMLHCSKLRKRHNLEMVIDSLLKNKQRAPVHNECRRIFTVMKRINSFLVKEEHSAEGKRKKANERRSWHNLFNWKSQCFLCGSNAIIDSGHPSNFQVHRVSTLPFRQKVIDICEVRNDNWETQVRLKLAECIDLVAVEARNHKICYFKFKMGRTQTETSTKDKGNHPGRPVCSDKAYNFVCLCEWLDKEGEVYTLDEIYERMVDFAQSDEYVYTKKRLKQKLEEKYGDFLMFSEIDGKRNVVCFRHTANYIINQIYYEERSSDPVEESLRVIKTAAKLIRSDIQDCDYNNLFYP